MTDLRQSPLDAVHRSLGAKMVPFGGWDMPLQYPTGTLVEHRTCRSSAVVFDVSHLGTVRVSGPDAFERLQLALTNDLARIEPGRCQYTHLLDDDASVLDDIIVWWRSPDVFDVMPNASNTSRVVSQLGAGEDVTATRAVLAVQGPQARQLLAQVSPEASKVGRFRNTDVVWNGVPCVVAGTGYTGEDGVEIAVPVDSAAALWQALVDVGITPAGLGARDTLRLEAGLPLHGHELGPGISSLQAGLGWVIGWDKPDFRGRTALLAQRTAGGHPTLCGFVTEGRRPPREDQAIVFEGETIGHVSSGNFSPILERGIGLGFTTRPLPVGTDIVIDMRGSDVDATIVELPFVSGRR